MRLLLFTFIFILFCSFIFAQEKPSRPSKDKAFMLDQTSPEQAVEILGKPQSDKIEKLDVLYIGKWIDDKFDKEKYRVLFYDQFEDLGKVRLTFLNEKLMAINFLLEKDVPAAQLSAVYKIRFIPIFNGFGIKDSVGEFDKLPRNVSAANFPRQYYLVGTGITSVITAKIFSGTEPAENVRKANTGARMAIRTKLPTGKATEIQILSRKILK